MTDALRERCASALHVLTDTGELHVAEHAVIFVYAQLGYGRWVAALRVPPLSWAAALGYRAVAGNRRAFAPYLFRGRE